MTEASMGPIEALKVALKLETEAAEFYTRHAVKGSIAEETFQFLVNEEVKHRLLIEKKIAELTRS